MRQKPRAPGLRWRRPASMAALAGAVVVGVAMLIANLTAVAAHDRRWFIVSGLAFLVFLALIAYGLAANNSRQRAERRQDERRQDERRQDERRRAARTGAAGQDPATVADSGEERPGA